MRNSPKKPVTPRQKQKAKRKRRSLRRRILLIGISGILLTALIAVILIIAVPKIIGNGSDNTIDPAQETVIELAFAGDLNVTDKVVEAGATDSGYDYSTVFQDILPLLADADQTVMNSCTINNGLLGLGETLNGVRAAGIEPLGAYASPEEFQKTRGFVLREIQGVKVAFVAFTKGMDNIALPAGQEDCVNLLYTDYTSTYQKVDTDGITAILRSVAAEKPDVTVALLHWGSEYNNEISKSQERIVKLMKSEGVDAIIGSHSHYLQKIDLDKETGTFVAYSLGDFWGDADRSASAYSAVLKLYIAKNTVTGKTRISGFTYDPIYTFNTETEAGIKTQLLQVRPAIADYEANAVFAVPEDVYTAMKSANARVEKLMTPEPKESE